MFRNLFQLKKYFVRYKKTFVLGIVFILLSNIGQVYIPQLIKQGINAISSHAGNGQVLKFVVLITLTTLVAGVFRFLIRQTIIVTSWKIANDLRYDFWNHLQKLSLRFYQNNSTGNIMSHATNDINAVRSFVGPSVMYTIDNGTKFLLVFFIMLSMNPLLTLYALLPSPIMSFLVYFVMSRVHAKYTKIQEKFADLTSRAQENFSGIRVIKSYNREEYETENYSNESKEYLKRKMDLVKLQATFIPVFSIIAGLSFIIVLWAGGTQMINGTFTIGELVAFYAYLGMLIWPMISFGWVATMVQQAEASMKRLLKIFNEPYEIQDTDQTKTEIDKIEGEIEFKNVSFKYANNLPLVLNNINLKIEKGSTVAFIGKTGTGKTSLVNLIPRFYDVTNGEVLIDGENVKHIPIETLRKNIGMVSQENFLFSDTLANNVTYGLNDEIENIIHKSAEIAQLSKDVESFPKGYNTVLGERGITLSGGQKQRSTLARALAIDPKILILDDSFSAVDTNTEEEILRRLKEFMKNRTSIIISHRISTVKDADKIFVLHEGKIAEQGTHQELIELNGIYADLNKRQLLEEELSIMD
ncbi:MAG: ABC transporter ATP-binding protein [Ignavibacteria bacterium]|nr:ABC transporter ATP-binding protein [Ignavibacteria bacterium]